MVDRNENGKLRFDDMEFTIMLGDMISKCNSIQETKFLIERIRDCVETFCDEIESDLEDYI